jgi:peroxiredoxin Q/BCP
MTLRTLAAAGVALLLGAGGAHAQEPAVKAGEAAPNFTLPGSDGQTYTLADYRGRSAVVLAWFPKAFTAG